MEESKGRVCVTGGTGFIGSWIIKRLLEDGYSVNTTVRSSPGKSNAFFVSVLKLIILLNILSVLVASQVTFCC